MKKNIIPGLAIVAFLTAGIYALQTNAQISACPGGGVSCTQLSGYAWSSNIGWVSFNSANTGAGGGGGGGYSVNVSTTTGNAIGTFSGYAWSPNIGWISFNSSDVSGCPSDSAITPINGCVPSIDFSNGKVTGWARVLSMESENPANGWLELSGTKHLSPVTTIVNIGGKNYYNGGVTGISNSSSYTLNGFAWESSSIGWLSFDAATQKGGSGVVISCTDPNCSGNNTSPNLTLTVSYGGSTGVQNLTVANGNPVTVGGVVTFNWNIQNLNSCILNGSNWRFVSNNGSISGSHTSLIGSGNMTFNTANNGYSFGITCQDSSNIQHQAYVNIDVVVSAPPVTCVQPSHSLLCAGSSTTNPPNGTPPSSLYSDAGSCPSSGFCQYYCDVAHGYIYKNGICGKSNVLPF